MVVRDTKMEEFAFNLCGARVDLSFSLSIGASPLTRDDRRPIQVRNRLPAGFRPARGARSQRIAGVDVTNEPNHEAASFDAESVRRS
jgi:hypothetical protein